LEDGKLMMEEEQESPRVMPLRNDSGFEKALENIDQELERKKIYHKAMTGRAISGRKCYKVTQDTGQLSPNAGKSSTQRRKQQERNSIQLMRQLVRESWKSGENYETRVGREIAAKPNWKRSCRKINIGVRQM
jgi:hypothetical protein